MEEKIINFKRGLLAKEYGSNIYELVQYITVVDDKEERTKQALLLKRLVEKMHPTVRYAEDSDLKIWQDMYLMSGMKMDIDVEFDKPTLEVLTKKPEKVEYQRKMPRFKHYGRNIELIMEKLINEEDEEKRSEAIVGMGKLMKTFYKNWNKDSIEDTLIAKQISMLSNGKIEVPKELLEDETVFDTWKGTKGGANSNNNPSSHSHHHNNRRNNNNNNNRKRKRK